MPGLWLAGCREGCFLLAHKAEGLRHYERSPSASIIHDEVYPKSAIRPRYVSLACPEELCPVFFAPSFPVYCPPPLAVARYAFKKLVVNRKR